MLNKEQARAIALAMIAGMAKADGRDYMILEDAIVERELVWAFPFNSRTYAATRNARDMVLGLAPIVVKRGSGAARMALPMPFEDFLTKYAAEPDESSYE